MSDGDRLHAETTGPADAPVLVLGSSLGTTSALWEPQFPHLTDRFRVLRFDHLGHGGSDVPPGPYTLDRLGRAVLALLDDAAIERVSYAGLSLGGMVGMWLAAHAPERVDRLALLCTAAWLPTDVWRERAAAVRASGTGPIAETVVKRWFTPGWAAAHPDVVRTFRSDLEATPDEGYAACCDAIGTMDLRPVLSGIAAPTLVIGGASDPATPVVHQQEIVAGIPGSRLAVVPAAHLASVEQADPVTRLLVEHLSVEPRPAGG